MPNPPQQIVKRIEKIMYNFLWDGKLEKIKKETLTGDYKNGGLKMIDIDIFIKSLKVSWIKRTVNSEEKEILNKMYLHTLQPFGGTMLFECSFSKLYKNICSKQHFLKRYSYGMVQIQIKM